MKSPIDDTISALGMLSIHLNVKFHGQKFAQFSPNFGSDGVDFWHKMSDL